MIFSQNEMQLVYTAKSQKRLFVWNLDGFRPIFLNLRISIDCN